MALNVTVTQTENPTIGGGFVTVFPCGTRPDASNVNFVGGQTIPNSVIAPVSANGEVCFYVYGTAHLIADVSGYFPTGSGFSSLSPARVLDTRGVSKVGNAAGTAAPFVLKVLGKGGVPASGVGAVALNVTVTLTEDPTIGGGFVTVFPCGTRPDASNLNFVGGQTIPNSVIAPVSANGEVCFYVYGTAHLIADVSGYFPTGSPPSPTTTSTTSSPPGTAPGTTPATRFQAVYAVPADREPVAGRTAAFAQELSVVQDWFDTQTGGRHPIFQLEGARAEVLTVRLPQTAAALEAEPQPHSVIDDSIRATNSARFAGTFLVVVVEGKTGNGCGSTGRNVLLPVLNCSIFPSQTSSWPYNMSYLLAHELTHALGAVPACAPHASSGHVNDDPRDILYQGPSPRDWNNITLDPGNDDYYRHSNATCSDIDDNILLGAV